MDGMQSHFRVVIFSGADPDHILRLVQRIHREVPEARVCGVLTERRAGKSRTQRAWDFLQNLKDSEFLPYALAKICDGLRQRITAAGEGVLKIVHGGGPSPV